MADWALYWPRYPYESGADGEPATGWLTSRDWLVKRLHRGDRLWLFIGGDACGDDVCPYRAYVAQLLVVDNWGHFEDHEPGVRESPKFHIHGVKEHCVLVDPPILVDDIFRQPDRDPAQHIGIARQTPFELDDKQTTCLLSRLSEQSPEIHSIAIQRLASS